MRTIAILGRQPALGIAELESLFGSETIEPFGSSSCFIDLESDEINFNRLGGSVRIAKVLSELPSSNWNDIEKYLISTCPGRAQSIDGKLVFGISVFGLNVPPRKIAGTALKIKKAVKSAGNSVRMVPHDKTELGSATVLYNKLTAKNGWELLVISDGKTAYLAQTVKIQDIDAYSERDQARPMRDAKVGMLPPKLAQIIVNLSVSENTAGRILDPFCGTGVLLQEAMLMDYDIYGTDLEPRMIQYSIENLVWLDTKYPDVGDYRRIEVGDAARFKWFEPEKITNVAGETYLGQPLTTLPNSEHLSKIIYEVNLLHHKFLQNISSQISPGTKLSLAVPTWRGKREFLHLPTLDYLEDLGYTRMRFKHVENKDLIYHRENQVVGRELLVLEKR